MMKKMLALILTLLVLACFFVPQAMAWGTKTHNYTARLIVDELNELKSGNQYYLTLNQEKFAVPAVFGDAITKYPQAFYAGSLGPDLYPDLFAGRHWVHDGESMKWVKTMIDRVNSIPAGEQKDEAMAFTLGFMCHYCGDIFGMDYVNAMARGEVLSAMPLDDYAQITEQKKTDMLVYMRNLAVSTGLDARIDDAYNHTDVKAPTEFVMRNLIYDGEKDSGLSKNYDDNSVPPQFAYLVNFRSVIHMVSDELKKIPGFSATASIFTEKWIKKFDDAVARYVESSNIVAQRILLSHSSDISETRIFVEEVSEWIEKYGSKTIPFSDIGVIKKTVANLISKVLGYQDFRSLIVDLVFEVLDLFDRVLGRVVQIMYPGTNVKNVYDLMREPAQPLFSVHEQGLLRDFALDAATLQADSAAGTDAANQSMDAIYNSLTMMKLLLIGPEGYQGLLTNIDSVYKVSKGEVTANSIRITIHTGNEKYVGTDDNIYLNITGTDITGKPYTRRVLLDKSAHDDFERDITDVYNVDLGADTLVSSLSFELENYYLVIKDDWLVDWVEIVPYTSGIPLNDVSAGRVTYDKWLDSDNKTLKLTGILNSTRMEYTSPLNAGILPDTLVLDKSQQWMSLQLWGNETLRREKFFTLFKGYSPDAKFVLKDGTEIVDQTVSAGDVITIDAELIANWNGIPATRRASTWHTPHLGRETYRPVTGTLTYYINSDVGRLTAISESGKIAVEKAEQLTYTVPHGVNTITIIASYNGDLWNAPASYEVAKLRVVDNNRYALTVENGTIDGTNDTSGLYAGGAPVSVTADVPSENTYFIGWESEDIALTAEQKARTTLEFDMPAKDVTVTACYEVIPPISDDEEYYALSVVNGTGSGVYEAGDQVIVVADAAGSDEMFAGWESNDVELTAQQKMSTTLKLIMPEKDVVITACYAADPGKPKDETNYRVSVIYGTGDGIYAMGTSVTVEADVIPNKRFIGWESNDISLNDEPRTSAVLTFIMPKNDVILVACYEDIGEDDPEAVRYALGVVNGTGSGVYEAGENVIVVANEAGSDEVFAGWTSDDVALTAEQKMSTTLELIMPAKDVVLTAHYAIDPNKPKDETNHRVSVINGTGDGIYAEGTSVTVEADVMPDKRFVEWESYGVSLNGEQRTSIVPTFTMPANDVVLVADYEDIGEDDPEGTQYALSVIGGTGDGLYEAGERVTAVALSADGWSFTGWTSNDMTLSDAQKMQIALTFDMPANDVTLTANYNEKPSGSDHYKLSVISGTGDGLYEAGELVTITAIAPKKDMRFDGWVSSEHSVLNSIREISYTFEMPAKDVTVAAQYVKEERFVLTVVNGMGDGVYKEGAEVLVTANEAPEGWVFAEWSSDQADLTKAQRGSKAFKYTMPSEDVTLTALYRQAEIDPDPDPEPKPDPIDERYYTVIVINGTGDGVYKPGETVTVNLVETEDTEFIGWQFINVEDEALLGENDCLQKSFSFTMPERNVRIIGAFQFAEVTHQLVVVNGTGDGVHYEGDTVVVEAYSDEKMNGAKFVRWESEELVLTQAQAKSRTFKLTMPGWDVVLTAVFKEEPPQETMHHVEVIGGRGSGSYRGRELVGIMANTPQPGMCFVGWTSEQMDLIKIYPLMSADMELLAFYMPECDVTITANYEPLPSMPPTGDGSRLLLWLALMGIAGAAMIMLRKRTKN